MSRPVSAILSLGSNLGDRERNIREAVADIAALAGVEVVRSSGLVETAAVKPDGVDTDAPAYLNAVVEIATDLTPEVLLEGIARIETEHGRVRELRWGDRTLDIDIVAFADLVQDDPALSLPHPRARDRAFVLVPWLDLDPNAILVGVGRVDSLPAASENVRRYPAEALS